jgi:cobalamin biosynthesis Mg chelatase CobN
MKNLRIPRVIFRAVVLLTVVSTALPTLIAQPAMQENGSMMNNTEGGMQGWTSGGMWVWPMVGVLAVVLLVVAIFRMTKK